MTTPVCSYTLVKEGTPAPSQNYTGTPLQRCSRCKGVWYSNQDAQKKQWKIHKKCCLLLSDEAKSEIEFRPLDKVNDDLKVMIYTPGGSPELYHVLKRLRQLYDDKAENYVESACRLHGVARTLIFQPNDNLMLSMVASPHMANLLFGDEEDLLNPKTRMEKYQLGKTNGRPSDEYIEYIADTREKEELRRIIKKYDELDHSWGEPGSMSYCYIHFNLIVACAIQGRPSTCSVHDGNGQLRGHPSKSTAISLLATAALRKAMELWTDKHVLESCGDAMAPAASLALTAVGAYEQMGVLGGEACKQFEIVPGLSFDAAVMTCMRELLDGAGSREYSGKLLKVLGENIERYAFAWEDLPVERCARVVLAVLQYVTETEDNGDDEGNFGYGYTRSVKMPSVAVNNILKAMCGNYPGRAREVLQKAANDGELIGPNAAGLNIGTRAFVYHLIRADRLSDEWSSLDLVQLAKDFDSLPSFIRSPTDDEKVKDKNECLRLARGDKLHEWLLEIFRR